VTRILRIDCSPRGAISHSRRLADEMMEELARQGATVVVRDLARDPPPIVDAGFAAAMMVHLTAEGARGVAALDVSERLIAELEACDLLLLSTPMHNFTVPALLKAWLDQVVRFGRTFRSTPEGKIGLLRDRPTLILVASGGYIIGERARQPDFLTPYLTAILATIGIRDVHFVHMDGMTRDEAEGIARARAIMRATIASLRASRGDPSRGEGV
jgi:FMN-dependent NADH-azoreductase